MWDTSSLDEPRRIELAHHYVQRTRRDIENQWEGSRCFPTRESDDKTYPLSSAYRELFSRTYDFCEEVVTTGQHLDERRRRVRYWGALALLGCVMSSPAAAVAALAARREAKAFDPQRAIKPEVVRRELEAADEVLGDPDAVRRFVLDAGQRLALGITSDRRADVFRVPVDAISRESMPPAVRFAIPPAAGPTWRISFTWPTPDGAEYLGRNHPFVAALARFLMEEALEKGNGATAVRCGVVRTRAVSKLRTILLLRVRYLLEQPERATLLSEEVWVRGVEWGPRGAQPEWLPDDEALGLLAAVPDANVPLAEKQQLIASALDSWPALEEGLRAPLADRAGALRDSHSRVRRAVGQRVRQLSVAPQHPPDLLGMLLLQPVV